LKKKIFKKNYPACKELRVHYNFPQTKPTRQKKIPLMTIFLIFL